MANFRADADTESHLGLLAQLNRILPWIIGASVLGLVLSYYVPQIHKNEALRRQLETRTEEAERLESEVNRLRSENFALTRDPRTVERTARELLSFARPDERVVTFSEPAPVSPAPPPGQGVPPARGRDR